MRRKAGHASEGLLPGRETLRIADRHVLGGEEQGGVGRAARGGQQVARVVPDDDEGAARSQPVHERVEGGAAHDAGQRPQHAVFWQVILQIVVLDAVFSLDSVITAVGMVDELAVMIAAVIASKEYVRVSPRTT